GAFGVLLPAGVGALDVAPGVGAAAVGAGVAVPVGAASGGVTEALGAGLVEAGAVGVWARAGGVAATRAIAATRAEMRARRAPPPLRR
nr:hypothetical protein [Actinomycetota bacterium]